MEITLDAIISLGCSSEVAGGAFFTWSIFAARPRQKP